VDFKYELIVVPVSDVDRGVEVSEPFHFGPQGQTPGLHPDGRPGPGRADALRLAGVVCARSG
jgi:hypothetical protein